MSTEEIAYLAIDCKGNEYHRPARIIAELPTAEERLGACQKAAQFIAGLINRPSPARISFGIPAYLQFGMTRAEAQSHPHANLLLKAGCDMPLTVCANTSEPAGA